MNQMTFKSKCKIDRVDTTEEILTGRGGMALFVHYLSKVNIYTLLSDSFASLRRSQKGEPTWNIFNHVICSLHDVTSRHLVYFDRLKKDKGYAAVIEKTPEEMISSHQVKRLFKTFAMLAKR